MYAFITTLLLSLALNAAEPSLVNKTFVHQIGTDQECEAWIRVSPTYNCFMTLQFVSAEQVLVKFSEKMTLDSYSVLEGRVTVNSTEFGALSYKTARNEKTLTDARSGVIFVEVKATPQ